MLKEATAEVLQRCLERERSARKQAEQLLEEKSRQLYLANQELEKAAQALKDEAACSQAIVETAAESILIIDDQGQVQSANPAAQDLFGLSGSDLPAITSLIPSAELRDLGDGRQLLLSPRASDADIMGRRLDGSDFPIDALVGRFTIGDRINFSVLARNLTRRKELERQLAQAQKLESVGILAAGIAHEINTPIQYVADNARFLMDSVGGIEQLFQCVEAQVRFGQGDTNDYTNRLANIIQQSDLEFAMQELRPAIEQTLQGAEGVAKIVHAMKGFSHPGGQGFHKTDINAALENTLTVTKSTWKLHAQLACDLAPDLPAVDCLPGELNQAFLNLVINAAHAMEDGQKNSHGTLSIRTRPAGDHVEISIADTGTGIPQEIQHKIFDPFFTTKGVGVGTGQGLAITYNVIVEKHNGSIQFDTLPGEGTCFTIRLPIRQPQA